MSIKYKMSTIPATKMSVSNLICRAIPSASPPYSFSKLYNRYTMSVAPKATGIMNMNYFANSSVLIPGSLVLELANRSPGVPTEDTTGKSIASTAITPTMCNDGTRGYVVKFADTLSYLYTPFFDIPSSYTKMLWVAHSGSNATRNLIGSTSGTTSHGLWYSNITDVLYSGHSTTLTASAQVSDVSSSNFTSWTHYAVTYDNPSTSMNLYRNAQLITSNVNNANLSWSGGNGRLVIGSNFSPTSFAYLDNIRVFNTPLTQNQILSIYNQEVSGSNWNYSLTTQPPTSLVFEILMDSSASIPTVDTTGKAISSSSPAPTIYADATRGNVLQLSSSYLFVPSIDVSASYTKMCWIYSKVTSQGTGNLISSYAGASRIHYWWYNGTVYLQAGHSPTGAITPYVSDPTSTPINTWIHFALTYDQSTTTIKLYRNAQLVSSATNAALSWIGGDGKLGIGTYGGGNVFAGYFDNVRVFNVALTSTQINSIYTQEVSGGNWNYNF